MWNIPDEIMATGSDAAALGVALEQVTDPEQMLIKVRELYATPDAESFDIIDLKDGHVFERYSKPQRVGGRGRRTSVELPQCTERRRAEEAVREGEERFRRLTMVTLEGIIIHEGGVVIDANPAFSRMFGYTLPELIGRNAVELIGAPEWRERLKRNVRIGLEEPYRAWASGRTAHAWHWRSWGARRRTTDAPFA